MINYIIWNPKQIIFSIGSLPIRWYGVCILLTFLGGRQIVRFIYQKEDIPQKEADDFSAWVLCTALLGARLGEIIFYNFGYYLSHPIEAFLPITFDPHFKFTGYTGLSYHGAIAGSLVGTYLYANHPIKLQYFPFRWKVKREKRKEKQFLWLSTPLALAMMMGFLVRIANFINSEIIGTPTKSEYGVLFTRDVQIQLQKQTDAIKQVKVYKNNTPTKHVHYQPITLELTFNHIGNDEKSIKSFLEKRIKSCLTANKLIAAHVYESPEQPLNYTLSKTRRNAYVATVETLGIPRHPVQLYESMAYLITLLLHLYWWQKRHKTLPSGVLAGSAMIFCYSLRFIGEFFKEPFEILSESFVTLTMGHLLSLLTVLGGIVLIVYSHTISKKEYTTSIPPPL